MLLSSDCLKFNPDARPPISKISFWQWSSDGEHPYDCPGLSLLPVSVWLHVCLKTSWLLIAKWWDKIRSSHDLFQWYFIYITQRTPCYPYSTYVPFKSIWATLPAPTMKYLLFITQLMQHKTWVPFPLPGFLAISNERKLPQSGCLQASSDQLTQHAPNLKNTRQRLRNSSHE